MYRPHPLAALEPQRALLPLELDAERRVQRPPAVDRHPGHADP
jgi:hypothetical protein